VVVFDRKRHFPLTGRPKDGDLATVVVPGLRSNGRDPIRTFVMVDSPE
jgi:hypothetical protein